MNPIMKHHQLKLWNIFIIIFVFKWGNCFLNKIYTNKYDSDINDKYLKKICNNRDEICKCNDTIVCTVRLENDTFVYKDFENSCYLFLSNVCDYPDNEYSIIEGDTCKNYLDAKRSIQRRNVNDTTDLKLDVNSTSKNDTLRAGSNTTFKHLYPVERDAYDRICPLSCPEIYSPVCLYANRNNGKYYKYYKFVNRCQANIFYCKNHEVFAPPAEQSEEAVGVSGLGWSHCGSYRYMHFNRFAESASSMGHYGWLKGNYRYTHIMEPHQRIPGFG